MDYEPWVSPRRPDVSLVALDPAVIAALADGDLEAARALAPVGVGAVLGARLGVGLLSDDARRTWRFRVSQLEASPADGPWITRAIVDSGLGRTVGMAGFHGPPDDRGMVEFGYRVDAELRRQGYARAALEALLVTATQDPGAHVVRATIAPDNVASRSLVLQYAFVQVGEQWDPDDGLEIIFERPADWRLPGA